MVWRILKYTEHLFHWRYRWGRHIHSPYLFEFIHEVVFNASKHEVPAEIRIVHRALRKDRNLIPAGTLGAKSAVDNSENRTVGSFVRSSSVSEKYGAVLYRITRWFKPETIVELGTGLGVSAMYLATGSPQTQLHTIEGSHSRADFSHKLIKRCGLKEVKVHRGELEKKLEELIPDLKERFVAFVDGNHYHEPTVRYVRSLVDLAGDEALIVVDDIYWSKEMQLAWKEVISWPEVKVSIDLFHMGILLLRRDLQKARLKIKF